MQIDSNDKAFCVIPMKVMHDCTYGRQYLLAYDIAMKKPINLRLDKIRSLKENRDLLEEEIQSTEEIIKVFEHCWCTSIKDESPQEIKIQFSFDENEEAYILKRIIKEGHTGNIDKINDGIYEYTISVYDPGEMVPWIRSFGERAKVISSGNFKIETRIKDDWNLAVKKYESISRGGK